MLKLTTFWSVILLSNYPQNQRNFVNFKLLIACKACRFQKHFLFSSLNPSLPAPLSLRRLRCRLEIGQHLTKGSSTTVVSATGSFTTGTSTKVLFTTQVHPKQVHPKQIHPKHVHPHKLQGGQISFLFLKILSTDIKQLFSSCRN